MENSDLHLTTLDFDISFNLDIFEVGIINLIITIILVGIYIKNNLPKDLDRRKDIIIKKIEDAEIKLKEARQRLNAARKQFNQIDIIVNYIRNESINTKKKLLESDLIGARIDLKVQFERAYNSYFSKERIVFLEIKSPCVMKDLRAILSLSTLRFFKGQN